MPQACIATSRDENLVVGFLRDIIADHCPHRPEDAPAAVELHGASKVEDQHQHRRSLSRGAVGSKECKFCIWKACFDSVIEAQSIEIVEVTSRKGSGLPWQMK